jgi:hypothetical protein
LLATVHPFPIAVLLFATALVAAGAAATAPDAKPAFAGPIQIGRLEAPPRQEASGLAASRRTPGLLWIHDDSGGQPVLYAVEENGKRRGTVRVSGTRNEDWEDIAACEFDGKPWLIVGDVGDNDAKRTHVLIHVVEEPKTEHLIPAGDLSVAPAFSVRIVYEDGARDCESVAVDVNERMVYLLTKRDMPPRLYRVPLAPVAGGRPVIAQFVGIVPHLPQPTALQRALKGHLGRRRAEVCAMDFAPDGRSALVLTYGTVLHYERMAGEPWAQALARGPRLLAPHDLPQAEAACYSADGSKIYVGSERTPKLLRYDRH